MTPTQKARDAAIFCDALRFQLLAASTPDVPRAEAVERITRAFSIWPSLTKRMAELSELAPHSARQGQDQADRIRDVAERAGGQG